MRATAAGLSDLGRQRVHNEDHLVLLPELNLFAVADGLGGMGGGVIASELAADAIIAHFRAHGGRERSVGDTLQAAVIRANADIFARYRGIGTTLVAAAYDPRGAQMFIAHAGNSRCYRLRSGELVQRTRDHSLTPDMIPAHRVLSDAERTFLLRNTITRALGTAPSIDVDLQSERVEIGDLYLLCSDGLHALISDTEIASIIERHAILPDACAALVDAANTAGGTDNITVLLIRIEDSGSSDR